MSTTCVPNLFTHRGWLDAEVELGRYFIFSVYFFSSWCLCTWTPWCQATYRQWNWYLNITLRCTPGCHILEICCELGWTLETITFIYSLLHALFIPSFTVGEEAVIFRARFCTIEKKKEQALWADDSKQVNDQRTLLIDCIYVIHCIVPDTTVHVWAALVWSHSVEHWNQIKAYGHVLPVSLNRLDWNNFRYRIAVHPENMLKRWQRMRKLQCLAWDQILVNAWREINALTSQNHNSLQFHWRNLVFTASMWVKPDAWGCAYMKLGLVISKRRKLYSKQWGRRQYCGKLEHYWRSSSSWLNHLQFTDTLCKVP